VDYKSYIVDDTCRDDWRHACRDDWRHACRDDRRRWCKQRWLGVIEITHPSTL